jgi:hypothetical protein
MDTVTLIEFTGTTGTYRAEIHAAGCADLGKKIGTRYEFDTAAAAIADYLAADEFAEAGEVKTFPCAKR